MADYHRYGGSKEKIGVILSTTDNSEFIIEKATVSISGYPSPTHANPRPGLTGAITDHPCNVDNKNEQLFHKVEYLWEVKSAPGTWTAEFSMHLSDSQIVVRSVSVTVG